MPGAYGIVWSAEYDGGWAGNGGDNAGVGLCFGGGTASRVGVGLHGARVGRCVGRGGSGAVWGSMGEGGFPSIGRYGGRGGKGRNFFRGGMLLRTVDGEHAHNLLPFTF